MPTIEGPTREADVPTRALVAFLAATFAVTWGVIGFYVVAPATAAALLGEIDGSHPAFFLATWSPAIAAVAVVSFKCGWSPGLDAAMLTGEVAGKPVLRVGEP